MMFAVRTRLLNATVAALVLLGGTALALHAERPSPRTPAPVEGGLETVLAQAAPGDLVPLLVGVEGALSPTELLAEARGYRNLAQRREHVVRRLKANLRARDGELRRFLDAERAAGRLEAPRPLWLANAWVLRLRAHRVQALRSVEGVERVRYDRPVRLEEAVDDRPTTFGPPRSTDQVHSDLESMGVRALWDEGWYGQGIILSMIDTGADMDHPNLVNRLWTNPGEVPGNGVDDDGNGYVDDVHGWNFYSNNNILTDYHHHGTNVAGLLVGDGSIQHEYTGIDTTGSCPAGELIVIRNWQSNWSSQATHPLAMQYAVENGARIISCSMSYDYYSDPDLVTLRYAHEAALAAGAVKFNSTGNRDPVMPQPWDINAPANCPPPWLHPDQVIRGGLSAAMAVGAVDDDFVIEDFSDHGPSAWDSTAFPAEFQDYPWDGVNDMGLLKPELVGPHEITTTHPGGYFRTQFTGTSASTPSVAGAAGLLLSAHPQATPEELAEALMTTADDYGAAGMDTLYGAGFIRVDLAHAFLDSSFGYGALEVTVEDGAGQPVDSVTVTLDGVYEVFLDQTPGLVPRVRSGSNTVSVAAEGFAPWVVQGVDVAEGDTTRITAVLAGETEDFGIIPTLVDETIGAEDTLTVPFQVSNESDTTWRMHPELRPEGGYDWQQDGGFGFGAGFVTVYRNGAAWFDSSWVLAGRRGEGEPRLWRFDEAGTLLDSLPQPGSANGQALDLAAEGDTLLLPAGSVLYFLDTAFQPADSLDLAGTAEEIEAVAWDREGGRIFLTEVQGQGEILELGRDGALLATHQITGHGFGLAWDGDALFGPTLYVLDRESPGLARLVRYDPATGQEVALADLAGEGLDVAHSLDVARMPGQSYTRLVVLQSASGVRAFDREIRGDAFAFADTALVAPGDTLVPLAVYAPRLAQDTLHAWEVVWHNLTEGWEHSVPVAVEVRGPDAAPEPPALAALPRRPELAPPWPNPFNARLAVRYSLPEAMEAGLRVYDLLGRRVATLARGHHAAGPHQISWRAQEQASGIYFIVLESDRGRQARKVLLLK